jgi:hypothetical protein
VIRHDIFGLFEPVGAYLVQYLPFPGNMRDDAVEGAVSIGRHENEFVGLDVDIADLADLPLP